MTPETVQSDPIMRQLYKLCVEAPPAHPTQRPVNLRWMLFDAGYYPTYAKAYADGKAGKPAPEGLTIARAAWLAGRDAGGAQ